MTMIVLNAGSSSVKFAAYDDPRADETPLVRGNLSGLGSAARLSIDGADTASFAGGRPLDEAASLTDAIDWVLDRLAGDPRVGVPEIVGHRVVHGGQDFARPVIVDDGVLDQLDALSPLAPKHQPFNLAGARRAAAQWPNAAQVACFDTAFHRGQDRLAQIFALPAAFEERGIVRYGFHGLSYDYIADVAPRIVGEAARGRMIVAHLGHGASLCALRDGESVSTTMGFTALDGLPMAARSGSIDPGVLLHLMQNEGMSADAVSDLLYRRAGLLGLSGLSDDMRTLEESAAPRAALAIDYFVHRCVHEIGALTADLGGVDALVFTAGIGEHSARVRSDILGRLDWLGVELDAAANVAHGPRITTAASALSAWVIPTNEELMIARRASEAAP